MSQKVLCLLIKLLFFLFDLDFPILYLLDRNAHAEDAIIIMVLLICYEVME